jgi:hypothetical protein
VEAASGLKQPISRVVHERIGAPCIHPHHPNALVPGVVHDALGCSGLRGGWRGESACLTAGFCADAGAAGGLHRHHPARDVSMQWGGSESIPVCVLGQPVDVDAMQFSLVLEAEAVGDDDHSRPRRFGDFQLDLH